MPIEGYDFRRDQFPELLLRRCFPERTDRESGVIRDYLLEHLTEFERVSFSVRIGQGQLPAEGLEPGVARSVAFSSRKRIDIVGWSGKLVTLIEAKERVQHDVLGQLLRDRILWLEEYPDAPEPRLVAIGRTSDDDTVRALNANGIDVYLYAGTVAARETGAGGL